MTPFPVKRGSEFEQDFPQLGDILAIHHAKRWASFESACAEYLEKTKQYGGENVG